MQIHTLCYPGRALSWASVLLLFKYSDFWTQKGCWWLFLFLQLNESFLFLTWFYRKANSGGRDWMGWRNKEVMRQQNKNNVPPFCFRWMWFGKGRSLLASHNSLSRGIYNSSYLRSVSSNLFPVTTWSTRLKAVYSWKSCHKASYMWLHFAAAFAFNHTPKAVLCETTKEWVFFVLFFFCSIS